MALPVTKKSKQLTVADFTKKYPTVVAEFIFVDLIKATHCKKIVEETLAYFGKVDVLVNNTSKNKNR